MFMQIQGQGPLPLSSPPLPSARSRSLASALGPHPDLRRIGYGYGSSRRVHSHGDDGRRVLVLAPELPFQRADLQRCTGACERGLRRGQLAAVAVPSAVQPQRRVQAWRVPMLRWLRGRRVRPEGERRAFAGNPTTAAVGV